MKLSIDAVLNIVAIENAEEDVVNAFTEYSETYAIERGILYFGIEELVLFFSYCYGKTISIEEY